MATVPLSGTDIRIISGVPFSNDYKNTRWFESESNQRTYFNSKNAVHTMSDANFQRIENSNASYVKVNKHIDQLWGANYITFRNSDYNDKYFYGFVTRLEYVNKSMTMVHFQIDVFQTWRFEMKFKPSFVVREHCKLWNSDGTPVVNTIDEGLNYGTEYDTTFTYQYYPNGGYKWLVIVSKTPLESNANEVEAKVIGTVQPLSYYVIPFKDNDKVPNITLRGEFVGVTKPSEILNNIYKDENAVNNIVSLYVTDYIGIATTYTPSDGTIEDVIGFSDMDSSVDLVELTSDDSNYALIKVNWVKKFAPVYEDVLDNKYSEYKKVKESKLLMYPYTLTILDDFRGNRAVFKNEYLNTKNLRLTMKGSLGISNMTSVNLPEYNRELEDGQKLVTSNEHALIQNTPNDVPIINDYLASFFQGNRNAIQNQKASILFNGTFGALGNALGGFAAAGGANPVGVGAAGLGMVQGAGNTVLQLQGMEAKQQDIGNIPPQIAKMGSNTNYDYGNGYSGVFVIQKQIKDEYIRKLEDFFNMFGYKVNEVKVPNFHTRQNWNYVQTTSCTILGDFNNEDLVELKSIFDNGITLWHSDDVGNYDLANEVI